MFAQVVGNTEVELAFTHPSFIYMSTLGHIQNKIVCVKMFSEYVITKDVLVLLVCIENYNIKA